MVVVCLILSNSYFLNATDNMTYPLNYLYLFYQGLLILILIGHSVLHLVVQIYAQTGPLNL